MIRRRVPDLVKARSMLNAAVIDMGFVEKLHVKSEAAQSIVRSVYENFRILGDALLTAQGFETVGADHHAQMIDALTKLGIQTQRPLLLLHELRKIRHKVNYEGYIPTEEELKDILAIKEALWQPVLAKVKQLIEGKSGALPKNKK